jgi:hypothetical protein
MATPRRHLGLTVAGARPARISGADPDIAEQPRLNQIESLDQIKFAILEASGQISFIERDGG